MSIATRFAIIFSLVVLLATFTVGITVYSGAKAHLIKASTDRLEQTANVIRVRFHSSIEAIGKDARFLAATPPAEGLIRVWAARQRGYSLDPETAISDTEWRKQLTELFTAFLNQRPTYNRISFVGTRRNGLELVRVERRNDEILNTPTRSLNQVAGETFYQEAIQLPVGSVYLSDITVNQDTLDILRYNKPSLRAAVPVYTSQRDVFGIVYVDVDLRDILDILKDLVSNDKALYLANERGEFIIRPDLGPGFDYEQRRTYLMQDIFPDAMAVVNGEEGPIRIEATRSASGIPVSAYFERIHIGSNPRRHAMVLGITSPHAEILSGVKQVRDRSLLITLLFGLSGIALALVLSRYLTYPISQVTHALSRFGQDDWKGKLPLHRKDEIGVLARTYAAMAQKIQEQVIELENEERRQRIVLETSVEGIIVTDSAGRIESFNPASERIFGYSADEIVGKSLDVLILPLRENESDAREEGQFWLGITQGDEAIGIRKSGEQFPLAITWSQFELNGEKKYTVFFQDISDRKNAEATRERLVEELERERVRLKRFSETLEERVKKRTTDLVRINRALGQRNRELQDFAYVASHDLQEPLRKIRAFADLLVTEHAKDLGEDAGFYIQRMYDAAERMSALISDLLAFSRVTMRGQPYVDVDLGLLTTEVLSDFDMVIAQADAQVIVEDLPVIEADPTQMRQLLQNLIGNALKFRIAERKPVVRIYGQIEELNSRDGSREVVRLMVEDNGTGFDEKYLDRIFSPFQRLHTGEEYEGTGMGLSICRRIVERHDGSITARSRPGQGSTFVVTLPVRQRHKTDKVALQSRNSTN